MADLYANRRLTEGFPNLDRLAIDYFVKSQTERDDDGSRVLGLIGLMDRLIPLPPGAAMAVIGCGPVPRTLKVLREQGYNAVGVEPIPEFVERASEFLDDPDAVRLGAAECLPIDDRSLDVLFLENVLEHVESPQKSLAESFRVTKPGGVTYIITTNRQRLSLIGENGEFRVPFFNRLPQLLKESYVFTHLHYRPELANFTRRPAVHWFSFATLCALGRQAGFAEFYSPLDLRRPEDGVIAGTPLRRLVRALGLVPVIQRSPWLRSLALTQVGSDIMMWRRSEP